MISDAEPNQKQALEQTRAASRGAELNAYLRSKSERGAAYILQNEADIAKVISSGGKSFMLAELDASLRAGKSTEPEHCIDNDFFLETAQRSPNDNPAIILFSTFDKTVQRVYEILTGSNVVVRLWDTHYNYWISDKTEPSEILADFDYMYMKAHSAAAYMSELMQEIEKNRNEKPAETGFKRLDRYLDGGLYAGLYTLGAGTSLGKTTFTMNISEQIARSGRDVYIFSLEMSKRELMSKSISRITYQSSTQEGRTSRDIMRGTFSSSEIVRKAINEYTLKIAPNLYIYESLADLTVQDISREIKNHMQAKNSKPVVIIDYLQLIRHQDRFIDANDKQRTDKNIKALKLLSNELDIPILVISSLNRESYKDATQTINLSSFKESGSIEYSSDVVIGLQLAAVVNMDKEDKKNFNLESEMLKEPRMIDLVILKNRQGQRGKHAQYKYYPKYNHFEELDLSQFERQDSEPKYTL